MERTGAPLIEDYAVDLMDRNFFLNTRVKKLEEAIKAELSYPEYQRTIDGKCKYCGGIDHTGPCRVGKLELALSLS